MKKSQTAATTDNLDDFLPPWVQNKAQQMNSLCAAKIASLEMSVLASKGDFQILFGEGSDALKKAVAAAASIANMIEEAKSHKDEIEAAS